MGGGSDLQRLSGGENVILGSVTGVCAKACNYPFLVWKNTVQQGLPISLNPRVVYRGLPMACLNLGGTNAVQFGTTGFFQKLLAAMGTGSNETIVGGAFLGGLASGIPCSIWELCMIQQQRFGGSTLGTPAKFIKEFGWSSLARGSTMTMGRESMFTMSMLGITPLIQQRLVENSGIEKNSALAAGALTGAIFAGTITCARARPRLARVLVPCFVMFVIEPHCGVLRGACVRRHPMDTIKTCMQGDLGQVKYTDITSTGRLLAEEYGVMQGLFKGLSYRIALISTTFFLVNSFKQRMVPVLFPHALVEPQKTP